MMQSADCQSAAHVGPAVPDFLKEKQKKINSHQHYHQQRQHHHVSSTHICQDGCDWSQRLKTSKSWGKKWKLATGPANFLVPLSRMLSGNYWDTEMSVVRRRASVVNNFFKEHLLLNYLANLNQTSQECSLGGPFSK